VSKVLTRFCTLSIYSTGLHQLKPSTPSFCSQKSFKMILFSSRSSGCGACGKVYFGLVLLGEGCGQNCG